MMIEPPRQVLVRRILEIDDRIDVAVKQRILKQLRRLVRHTRVEKLRPGRAVLRFEETAEKGCRSGPVKAMIVIQNSGAHRNYEVIPENLLGSLIRGSHCKSGGQRYSFGVILKLS